MVLWVGGAMEDGHIRCHLAPTIQPRAYQPINQFSVLPLLPFVTNLPK